MYYWRVSKYNPKYRKNNVYLNDEWTSISDIGKHFNGHKLTLSSYVTCEEHYIDTVILAMKELNIEFLKIDELEKYGYNENYSLVESFAEGFYDSLKKGMMIHIDEIGIVMKLMLREMAWGKLSSENLYVHFGYDYYMYMGSSRKLKKTLKYIENSTLFIQSMKSPYFI